MDRFEPSWIFGRAMIGTATAYPETLAGAPAASTLMIDVQKTPPDMDLAGFSV
jgi:hypothetical protein